MRKRPHLVLVLLLAAIVPRGGAGDLIDRIVVTVNGHVILQSDWEDAVRFEALVEGRPLDQITDQDRVRALDQLIDQELVREQTQVNEPSPPAAQEVQKRIQEIQNQHSATTPSAWQAALASYGFDEKHLQDRLAQDLTLMRQVEARLRPAVQIDPGSIESYYRDHFLPQLRNAGAQDVPLAQVSSKIREILTEKKVNELFSSWLQSLRAGSKITSFTASSPSPATGGQGQ